MKARFALVAIFLLSFLAGLLFFGARYFNFGLSLEELIIVLTAPLFGTSNDVIMIILKESLIYVVIPSVLCAVIITFIPNIWRNRYIQRFYAFIMPYIKKSLSHSVAVRLFICVCFLFIGFKVADKKLEITDMINYYFFAEYSNFYEEYYHKPNIADYKMPKTPRNLIVIFAESMESTYSSKNYHKQHTEIGDRAEIGIGGGQNSAIGLWQEEISEQKLSHSPHGELIPNLTQLAQKHINFSMNSVVGGHLPTATTGTTMSATVSYLCGIPLKLQSKQITMKNTILPSATCIGNILHNIGYKQISFTGAYSHFGKYDVFVKNQHFQAFDVKYFTENGMAKDAGNGWGLNDYELFSFAKSYLQSYKENKPFAMYISTIDSHFPGYVDREFCKDLELNYANSITCSDRIIGDFVEFVKQSKFGENTTIVILGDHLTPEPDFIPQNTYRYIYNVFINPSFTQKPSKKLIKHRTLAHYDFSALILDSIGIKTEAFGLGRNPLYQKILLEQLGVYDFNVFIKSRSKIYDSFWLKASQENLN